MLVSGLMIDLSGTLRILIQFVLTTMVIAVPQMHVPRKRLPNALHTDTRTHLVEEHDQSTNTLVTTHT